MRPPFLVEENEHNFLQPSDLNFVHPLANTMKIMVCHVFVMCHVSGMGYLLYILFCYFCI